MRCCSVLSEGRGSRVTDFWVEDDLGAEGGERDEPVGEDEVRVELKAGLFLNKTQPFKSCLYGKEESTLSRTMSILACSS